MGTFRSHPKEKGNMTDKHEELLAKCPPHLGDEENPDNIFIKYHHALVDRITEEYVENFPSTCSLDEILEHQLRFACIAKRAGLCTRDNFISHVLSISSRAPEEDEESHLLQVEATLKEHFCQFHGCPTDCVSDEETTKYLNCETLL